MRRFLIRPWTPRLSEKELQQVRKIGQNERPYRGFQTESQVRRRRNCSMLGALASVTARNFQPEHKPRAPATSASRIRDKTQTHSHEKFWTRKPLHPRFASGGGGLQIGPSQQISARLIMSRQPQRAQPTRPDPCSIPLLFLVTHTSWTHT